MDNSSRVDMMVLSSDRSNSISQEHTYLHIIGNRLSNRLVFQFKQTQCRRNLQHSLLRRLEFYRHCLQDSLYINLRKWLRINLPCRFP